MCTTEISGQLKCRFSKVEIDIKDPRDQLLEQRRSGTSNA
jgi:hypothetical protein